MKSAKKNQARPEDQHQDLVTVKAESESEEAFEVCVGEDGFNVQIKEEPHSQEIGDESDCKSGTVTSDSDIHQQEEHIKEEHTPIHVKKEEDLWLKEEKDSGEEEEEEEEADEREEGGTGRQQ